MYRSDEKRFIYGKSPARNRKLNSLRIFLKLQLFVLPRRVRSQSQPVIEMEKPQETGQSQYRCHATLFSPSRGPWCNTGYRFESGE
jgi:hypothetical protein